MWERLLAHSELLLLPCLPHQDGFNALNHEPRQAFELPFCQAFVQRNGKSHTAASDSWFEGRVWTLRSHWRKGWQQWTLCLPHFDDSFTWKCGEHHQEATWMHARCLGQGIRSQWKPMDWTLEETQPPRKEYSILMKGCLFPSELHNSL